MIHLVETFNHGPGGAYRYAAWVSYRGCSPLVSYSACPIRAVHRACVRWLRGYGRGR